MSRARDLLLGESPAASIATAVRAGRISARAIAEAALAEIAARDGAINAFTAVTRDRALAEADAVDAARAAGRDPGPLAGVPFAVKNLLDIAGLTTLAGARINRDHPPAARDAGVVERLCGAGAVLLGAVNMGEYAYDFTGENAHYGATRNPRDPSRMSGGSSGGSGAAVAAGFVPLAVGSDTNGSIRVPSSLCGIFGLKPTFGRVTRAGAFPFVASLDHLGPQARSVRDLALAYDVMQGHDRADPVSADRARAPAADEIDAGIGNLRLATAGGYFARGGAAAAHRAVDEAARALGIAGTIEIPEAHRARAAAYVITASEGAALHLPRLRRRAAEFDPATRDRFLAGAAIPAAWYVQAQRFRRWFHARMLTLFEQVDVILMPATPVTAPRLGQATMVLDGVEMPVRPNLGIFTQPISFIGLPAAVVPLPTADGLPIGVQIVAAPWRESAVLRVARALERHGIARSPAAA